MRFVVRSGDELEILSGVKGGAAVVSFAQALDKCPDITQAQAVDIGLTVLSISQSGNTPPVSAALFFETSMQNTDASNKLWENLSDPSGMSLDDIITEGVPRQYVMTVQQDLGRYLRWRLEIPSSTPDIEVSMIFKVAILGHG